MTEDLKWTERLPKDWSVQPLKFVAHVQPSNVNKIASDDEIPVRLCNYTDVYKNEFIVADMEFMRSTATEQEIEKFHLEVDDVIITKDSETADDIAIPAYVKVTADDLVCGYHLTMMRPNAAKLSGRYLHRVLGSKELRAQLELAAKGVTRVGIPQNAIGRASIPIPPLPTQRRIADYLDAETQRIDELIAAKRSMLVLLAKKRAALVSQAVTKGLNPNAKMKDSGLEWLGEIPEHWEIKPLRYWGWCQNGVSQGADYFGSGYPFVNYGDVYRSEALPFEVEGLANSTDADRTLYSVQEGDVFFTRTSETIHEIGMAATCVKTIVKGTFSGFVIRVRPFVDELAVHFSKYYFRSQALRVFFMREMNIITRASMSQDLLKQLPVLVPPMKEQLAIAEHLDKWNEQYAALSTDLATSIGLLVSRRSALITAAVTGQVGVPEAMSA